MMGSDGSRSPGAACAVCGGAEAVHCVADAAALCGACDAVVHAASLLASRHERVPLAATAAFGVYDDLFTTDDVDAVPSWTTMLPPPAPGQGQGSPQGSSEASFTTSSEEGGGASLFHLLSVDVDLAACVTGGGHPPDGAAPVHHHGAAAAPFLAPPDASTVVVPGAGAAVLAAAAEREKRVQRYREKRKNRRFKKTIRYASRKAYAEARPRIKGRFVKRDPAVAAPDSDAAKFWFSFSDDARDDSVGFYAAGAYGVVPSLWNVPDTSRRN